MEASENILPEPRAKQNVSFPRTYPFPIINDDSIFDDNMNKTWGCIVGYLQIDCVHVVGNENIERLRLMGFYGNDNLSKSTPEVCCPEKTSCSSCSYANIKKNSIDVEQSASKNESEDEEIEVVDCDDVLTFEDAKLEVIDCDATSKDSAKIEVIYNSEFEKLDPTDCNSMLEKNDEQIEVVDCDDELNTKEQPRQIVVCDFKKSEEQINTDCDVEGKKKDEQVKFADDKSQKEDQKMEVVDRDNELERNDAQKLVVDFEDDQDNEEERNDEESIVVDFDDEIIKKDGKVEDVNSDNKLNTEEFEVDDCDEIEIVDCYDDELEKKAKKMGVIDCKNGKAEVVYCDNKLKRKAEIEVVDCDEIEIVACYDELERKDEVIEVVFCDDELERKDDQIEVVDCDQKEKMCTNIEVVDCDNETEKQDENMKIVNCDDNIKIKDAKKGVERGSKRKRKGLKLTTETVETILLSDSSTDFDIFDKFVPSKKKRDSIEDKILQLTFEEAFFLSYGLGSLVVKENDQPLNLVKLWQKLCNLHPTQNFPVMYTAYHHFRSKGWIVRSGLKYGVDYVLYKDGPPFYHSTYAVIVKPVKESNNEDSERALTWSTLAAIERVCSHSAKILMFLYVVEPSILSENSPVCISEYTLEEVIVKRFAAAKNREEDI